ncbi:hypothetical protein ACFQHV_03010 [Promicromonospora thailandica]|uniref:Uncharacterized protein n=1 Tax=Promicromonospora thailandica TaxID=765201 RepID=A0A9X2G578_9MICO|nr:hypothetical protein [Promicromonospora thailandica]MCP2267370.1 hypothetical protein [Promicromonospora thailandica]BFF19611.1 hypothetical protein GCM10025730_31320 [Promicromonospora thailandica]
MIAASGGRAVTVVLVTAVIGAAAVACTAGGPATSSTAGPVPDDVVAHLSVDVAQGREQYAAREVRLEVANDSAETLTLLSGALDADGFGPSHPAKEGRELVLRPGTTRAVYVGLGDPVCTGATRRPASATVTLALGAGDGRGPATDVVVDEVGDPVGHLARNHEADCARAAVAAGAHLSVDREVRVETRDGVPTALVTLRVEPVDGGPRVTIDRIAGTTLMSNPEPADGASGWTGRDLAGQSSGVVVLAVVPARCDVHAVAEDKRGTFLPVSATVDGDPQPTVHVPMPDAARSAFYDFVGDHCAWPE